MTRLGGGLGGGWGGGGGQSFSRRANFLFFHEKRFVKFCKEM